MSTLEIAQAIEQIADTQFSGELTVHATGELDELPIVINDIQGALAERYGCTLTQDDNLPHMNFAPRSTWKSLADKYASTCSTKPRELFAEVALDNPSTGVLYTIPLAAMGRQREAIAGEYRYEAKPRKGAEGIIALGRTSLQRVRLTTNLYHTDVDAVTKHANAVDTPTVTDTSITRSYQYSGRIGTISKY